MSNSRLFHEPGIHFFNYKNQLNKMKIKHLQQKKIISHSVSFCHHKHQTMVCALSCFIPLKKLELGYFVNLSKYIYFYCLDAVKGEAGVLMTAY